MAQTVTNTGALKLRGAAETVRIRIPAILCALAVAVVPLFSYQERLAFIPQLFAIAACAATLVACFHWGVPKIHPAMAAYCGLTILFGVQMFWNGENWEAYLTMLKVCILSLALHFAIRSEIDLILVLGLYAASSIPCVVLNSSELADIRTEVMQADIVGGSYRFAGTLANENTAGMYGIIALLASLIVFTRWKSRLRWALLLGVGISGFVLCYYSGSRKAMIGLIIACLSVPFISGDRQSKLFWTKRFLALSAMTLVAFAVMANLPHRERLTAILKGGFNAESSSSNRFELLSSSLDLWLQRPFFGHGYGGFAQASGFGTYSHTTFSEILCNAGLCGMVLITIFYLTPMWQLARIILDKGRLTSRVLIGCLVFYLLFLLFSTFAVMFESRSYIPLCAAICGVLQGHRSSIHRSKRKVVQNGNIISRRGSGCAREGSREFGSEVSKSGSDQLTQDNRTNLRPA